MTVYGGMARGKHEERDSRESGIDGWSRSLCEWYGL